MRKRFRHKKRSCGLCKPHKRGRAGRWTAREAQALAIGEREIAHSTRQAVNCENATGDDAAAPAGAGSRMRGARATFAPA